MDVSNDEKYIQELKASVRLSEIQRLTSAKYTENEIVELFCEQYSKLENCEPIDVLNELKRSDKSFIRMLDMFRMGVNSK
jgi:hypothetical protein